MAGPTHFVASPSSRRHVRQPEPPDRGVPLPPGRHAPVLALLASGVGFRCMRVAGKTVCACFGVSCTQKKVDFCILSKLSVPLGPRAPYCPVRSCPYLPSPAPPAVRWTVRTFKIGVSNIAVNWLSTQLAPQRTNRQCLLVPQN